VAIQQRFNAASVLREGQVWHTYAKRELPNYQVFDERRYFTPGTGSACSRSAKATACASAC
jgi:NAD+ synthase (glutamine-hydrolysing)